MSRRGRSRGGGAAGGAGTGAGAGAHARGRSHSRSRSRAARSRSRAGRRSRGDDPVTVLHKTNYRGANLEPQIKDRETGVTALWTQAVIPAHERCSGGPWNGCCRGFGARTVRITADALRDSVAGGGVDWELVYVSETEGTRSRDHTFLKVLAAPVGSRALDGIKRRARDTAVVSLADGLGELAAALEDFMNDEAVVRPRVHVHVGWVVDMLSVPRPPRRRR